MIDILEVLKKYKFQKLKIDISDNKQSKLNHFWELDDKDWFLVYFALDLQ